MGCSGSKNLEDVKVDSLLSQALEKKLIHAVVHIKRRKSFKVKKSSFNNLMLQMPRLVAGFKKVREAWAVVTSGGTLKLTWVQFKSACNQSVGLDPDSESLKDVFSLPDVEDSMPVSYGDFILVVTVVCMLDSANKRRTIASQEVRACLELMEKSFMFFDSSADGCIERKELAMALKSGTRVFGRKASKSLADQLFDQLDWSRDGNITFKEWLIGMERIIIEMADDEDEDEIEADEDDDEDEGEEGEEEEGEGVEEGAKKADWDDKGKAASPAKPAAKVAATDEVRPFTRSGSGMAPQAQ